MLALSYTYYSPVSWTVNWVVIGLLFALVFAIAAASKNRQHVARTGVKLCKSCGMSHPNFARFCRSCGRNLDE